MDCLKRKFQVFFKKQLLEHVPLVALCGRKQKYVFYVCDQLFK